MRPGDGEAEEGSGWWCFQSAVMLRCTSSATTWSRSPWERARGVRHDPKKEGRRQRSRPHRGRTVTVNPVATVTTPGGRGG
jgi:hypothetical protein